nr:CLAVATA3/ESR (CLE)-related protein 1 [Ipomoea batatas]
MAGLVRFWMCLLLVLVAGLGCETRLLHPSPVILKKKGALMEQAQEIIKATISARVRVEYNVDRLSPGGPDPKHH